MDFTRFRPDLPELPDPTIKKWNRDLSYGKRFLAANRDDHGYCNVVFGQLIRMLLNPRSVVDLGAATGYVLAPLYQAGVDVLGVDISDSSKAYAEMAAPGLGERIIYGDLNEPLSLKKRHDVAVCIEVLEHLRPESADIAVRSVCAAADVCLVTASPGGGTHPNPLHLNEMPFQSYWVPKFEAEGKVISPEITTAIKVMMRTLYDLKWYIVPSWFFSGYFAAFVDAD